MNRSFTLILETTGSLFQSMFLLTHPITYSATNLHSKFISSSCPYFFPNLPLHQGVVYIIRRILWPAVCTGRYGTRPVRDRYGSQQILCPAVRPPFVNSLFNVLFFAERYAGGRKKNKSPFQKLETPIKHFAQ